MRVLFIDNLDSFTYNLVHCLEVAGAEVVVLRNEGKDWPEFSVLMNDCDAWVVGPGPGQPQDYPHLMGALQDWIGKKPLLGVCLGLQAIALNGGWQVVHGKVPMHGKSSWVEHKGRGLFAQLASPLQVGRYHSLVVQSPINLGQNGVEGLGVDARCGDAVMALSDERKGVWAVQFHPESVLTPEGQQMINQWLFLAAAFNTL
jgi:anthranilate synthase/aminodeoxychorismate synthase-like glutamine amidotransferase